MTKNFERFLKDVFAEAGISDASLDELCNIWYTCNNRNLVIPYSNVEEYYQAYLMSNQPRHDAVTRAANHIKKTITKYQKQWNKYSKK